MTLFDQWYNRHHNKKGIRELTREQIAKFMFLHYYQQMPDYMKENWRDYVAQYLIHNNVPKFTEIEHFDLYVIWCHERDIQI